MNWRSRKNVVRSLLGPQVFAAVSTIESINNDNGRKLPLCAESKPLKKPEFSSWAALLCSAVVLMSVYLSVLDPFPKFPKMAKAVLLF